MQKNEQGVEENVVRFYSTSNVTSFDSLQPMSAFRVSGSAKLRKHECRPCHHLTSRSGRVVTRG